MKEKGKLLNEYSDVRFLSNCEYTHVSEIYRAYEKCFEIEKIYHSKWNSSYDYTETKVIWK